MKNRISALFAALAVTLTVSACNNSAADTQTDNAVDMQTDSAADTQTNSAIPSISASETQQTEEIEETAGSETVSDPPRYSVPAGTEIEYEFTAEDEELHRILEELDNAWSIFARIANDPTNYTAGDEKGLWVNCDEVEAPYNIDILYLELSEELPFGNIEEMKAELNRCFTKKALEDCYWLFRLMTGETVSEENGVYKLNITDYGPLYNEDAEFRLFYPTILELDGRLYRMGDGFGSNLLGIDYSTTRVLSRTDDELVFAFIYPEPYTENIVTAKETLKFEDGGWKYDRFPNFPEGENYMDFYEVWGGQEQ